MLLSHCYLTGNYFYFSAPEEGKYLAPVVTSCLQFYSCAPGHVVKIMECSKGTLFDANLRMCVTESAVDCGERTRPPGSSAYNLPHSPLRTRLSLTRTSGEIVVFGKTVVSGEIVVSGKTVVPGEMIVVSGKIDCSGETAVSDETVVSVETVASGEIVVSGKIVCSGETVVSGEIVVSDETVASGETVVSGKIIGLVKLLSLV